MLKAQDINIKYWKIKVICFICYLHFCSCSINLNSHCMHCIIILTEILYQILSRGSPFSLQ